jgi:hypothetical protein
MWWLKSDCLVDLSGAAALAACQPPLGSMDGYNTRRPCALVMLPPNQTWGRRPKHSWKPQNGSRRTIPRLLGPLRDNFLDRGAPHDLDAIGILQRRSDHQKYETRTRASFAYDARALVSPAASPEQTFRTHRPCVAPPFFCASMSPTEVKVTLIPPPGRIWGELSLAFRIRLPGNGDRLGRDAVRMW